MNSFSSAELRGQVLRSYLQCKLQRPGRIRLTPEGYEEYGPSLRSLADSTQPLIFETEIEGVEYGIAGSCFLARYRGKLFVITANHCLAAQNGNDVRIGLNPETKSFLPLKQLHRAKSNPPNQDYADVAIFEAAPELLAAEERQQLQVLEFDSLQNRDMQIKPEARLVIPNFPKCLNEVDYGRFVIHMQRYLPSGKYLRATDRNGIHLMEFHEMDQIDHPDGMSGSPVLFVEEYPEAHFFGFLGMTIKASKLFRQAEFIGAPVIYYMLDAILRTENLPAQQQQ